MPTIDDLGRRFKRKYPGDYDDLSDVDVGTRVKAKYPGDYDDFSDQPTMTPAGPPPIETGNRELARYGLGTEMPKPPRPQGLPLPAPVSPPVPGNVYGRVPGMERLGPLPGVPSPPKPDMQPVFSPRNPLVSMEGIKTDPSKYESPVGQFTAGLQRGGVASMESLTTPENVGILGTLGATHAIPGVGQAIGAGAGLYFGYEMLKGAVESVPDAMQAWREKRYGDAGEIVAQAAASGLLAKGAVKHSLKRPLQQRMGVRTPPLVSRPMREMGERQAADYRFEQERMDTTPVPKGPKSAMESAEVFTAKPMPEPKSARESARVFEREVEQVPPPRAEVPPAPPPSMPAAPVTGEVLPPPILRAEAKPVPSPPPPPIKEVAMRPGAPVPRVEPKPIPPPPPMETQVAPEIPKPKPPQKPYSLTPEEQAALRKQSMAAVPEVVPVVVKPWERGSLSFKDKPPKPVELFNRKRLDVSPEVRTRLDQLEAETLTKGGGDAGQRLTSGQVIELSKRVDPEMFAADGPKIQQQTREQLGFRLKVREQLNGLIAERLKAEKELAALPQNADLSQVAKLQERAWSLERDSRALFEVSYNLRRGAGQALSFYRLMAKESFDTEYWMSRARRVNRGPLPDPVAREITRYTSEGQAAKDAAMREGRDPNADPRVQDARKKIAKRMATLEKTSFIDALIAGIKAGLLTSPTTHAVNMSSNTAFQMGEEFSRSGGAIGDMSIALFTNRRSMAGPNLELGRYMGRETLGVLRAIRSRKKEDLGPGFREALEVLRQGATEQELLKFESHREVNTGWRIYNTVVNGVFRTLSAEDRLAKQYIIGRSLQEQAKVAAINEVRQKYGRTSALKPQAVRERKAIEKQRLAQPSTEMMTRAVEDSLFGTFNNDSMIARLAEAPFKELRRHDNASADLARLGLESVMLFRRTPSNVVARVVDYTPAGAAGRIAFPAIEAMVKKSLTQEQQRAISMGFGRGLTGAALLYMGYMLNKNGVMTGMWKEDRAARNVDEAAGREDGAILIGGKWREVERLSPIGNLLVIGASMAEEDVGVEPGKILGIAGKTVLEQPMMQGMKDLVGAAQRPAAKMEGFLAAKAGMVIPSAVAQVARGMDDRERETPGLGGKFKARVPGLRETLPERRDVFGKPIKSPPALDPFRSTPAKELDDPVLAELLKREVKIGSATKKKDESDAELRSRARLQGQAMEVTLRKVASSQLYSRLPDTPRGSELRKLLLDRAAETARREIGDLISAPSFTARPEEERISIMERNADRASRFAERLGQKAVLSAAQTLRNQRNKQARTNRAAQQYQARPAAISGPPPPPR